MGIMFGKKLKSDHIVQIDFDLPTDFGQMILPRKYGDKINVPFLIVILFKTGH